MNAVQEGAIRARADENRRRFASLERDLTVVLNKHGADQLANTPDFILARFLTQMVASFAVAVLARDAMVAGVRAAMTTVEPRIVVPGEGLLVAERTGELMKP